MPDIASVVQSLRESGDLYETANSVDLSFVNTAGRVYLGAQLMPEEVQPLNRYDEEDFVILDTVARDAERYSPVRYRGQAAAVSSFRVELGDSDTGRPLSPREYEVLLSMMGQDASMEEMQDQILNFAESLTRSLEAFNEKQRWQAIVNGAIERKIGATEEIVEFPNAANQRVALTDAWTDDTVDPFDYIDGDVMAFAAEHGYSTIERIISRRDPWTKFKNNANVMRRSGLSIRSTNDAEFFRGRSSSSGAVNQMLQDEGFPVWEIYEDYYRDDETGINFYLPEDAVVFVFGTGSANIPLIEFAAENDGLYIPGAATATTIGYTGIGTVATQQVPGRIISINIEGDIVQYVRGGGKQTGLPVFRHPQGFLVAKEIA